MFSTQNLILIGVAFAFYAYRSGWLKKITSISLPVKSSNENAGSRVDRLGREFALAIQQEAENERADRLSKKVRDEIKAIYLGEDHESPKEEAGK